MAIVPTAESGIQNRASKTIGKKQGKRSPRQPLPSSAAKASHIQPPYHADESAFLLTANHPIAQNNGAPEASREASPGQGHYLPDDFTTEESKQNARRDKPSLNHSAALIEEKPLNNDGPWDDGAAATSTHAWTPPKKIEIANYVVGDWKWGFENPIVQKVEKAIERTLRLLPEGAVEQLLAPLEQGQGRQGAALLMLAAGYRLPAWARMRPAPPWELIAETLFTIALDAVALHPSTQCVERQLLASELPALLSCWFPKHRQAKAWQTQSVDAAAATLHAMADDSGVPLATHWQDALPAAASLLRCRMLANGKKPLWNADLQATWVTVASHLGRLYAKGGQFLCAPANANSANEKFISALCTSGLKPPLIAALGKPSLAIPKTAGPTGQKAKGAKKAKGAPPKKQTPSKQLKPVEPSFQSDEAYCTSLRAGWSSKLPSLTLRWHETALQGELRLDGELWLAGQWNQRLMVDGRIMSPRGDWESTCFVADEDVCYVELEQAMEEDWRIQRQFCLDRQGTFVLFADAVLGRRAEKLEYALTLPFTPGVKFTPEKESFEGWLQRGKLRHLALPLACPEWRRAAQACAFNSTPQGLQYGLARQGSAAYLPLWLDLRANKKEPFTWRQLTVAEQRNILPADVAVGYRVQTSGRQHVIYRSLAEIGNRTLLGHNTVNEFVLGKFTASGEVEPLLEIE